MNETQDLSQYYACLATIKPFGRPANRTVFFRGFLGDGSVSADESNVTDDNCTPEKLANVLIFVCDIRSGLIQDLIHGSRFAEICWYFKTTHEQIRISGELHVIASPHHPFSQEHLLPTPPYATCRSFKGSRKDSWEAKR